MPMRIYELRVALEKFALHNRLTVERTRLVDIVGLRISIQVGTCAEVFRSKFVFIVRNLG